VVEPTALLFVLTLRLCVTSVFCYFQQYIQRFKEQIIMSKDIFEARGDALEEEYFRRQNRELVEKMKQRLSTEGAMQETSYDCPKCEGKLQTGNFESIQIDICDTCGGVWLDAGELQQIAGKQESGWLGRLFG
jgi:hypothetical protein